MVIQGTQCTYNVRVWRVRLMFIPNRLSYQPDTISKTALLWRYNVTGDKNKNVLRSSCKLPDNFALF